MKKIEDKWRFGAVLFVFGLMALSSLSLSTCGVPVILHILSWATIYLFFGCLISGGVASAWTSVKTHMRLVFTWMPFLFSERIRKWTVGESI